MFSGFTRPAFYYQYYLIKKQSISKVVSGNYIKNTLLQF